MKKLLIIILNVFILQCYPQNLIKNPSFEDYYSCPSEISQIDSSKYWTSGLNECSSDYYHTCMLVNNNPGSLEFECLTKHKGRTGFAFAGIILANKFYTQENNQINYREAIQTKLYHQLISNNCYTVEFYFKFYGFWCSPNSSHINFAINSFGAFLSQDSIVYDNLFSETIFTHAPQVKFNEFTISDSINWKKISGSFFANGNEQFITITNFSTNDSTQFEFSPYLNSNSDSLFGNFSYYIIDDVSVYPCDAPVYFADAGKDTCVKHGSSIILGLPNHDEYLYWWINGNTGDTISRQSQIVVSPQVTTKYILVQKDFKFDETRDSITVKVGNCNGSPDYRGVDFEIFPNPNNGNFQVRFNTSIPDGAILQLHDMLGRIIGEYKLDGSGNTASLNIEVAQAIYCATVIIPNVFKKSVKIVVVN